MFAEWLQSWNMQTSIDCIMLISQKVHIRIQDCSTNFESNLLVEFVHWHLVAVDKRDSGSGIEGAVACDNEHWPMYYHIHTDAPGSCTPTGTNFVPVWGKQSTSCTTFWSSSFFSLPCPSSWDRAKSSILLVPSYRFFQIGLLGSLSLI